MALLLDHAVVITLVLPSNYLSVPHAAEVPVTKISSKSQIVFGIPSRIVSMLRWNRARAVAIPKGTLFVLI